MKMPPFLLGAALLFWGWQSGFLIVGAVMAVVLESSRFVKTRWDLSDEDFHRIWTFCTLLILAAIIFAFTLNEGDNGFSGLFHGSAVAVANRLTVSGERTATAFLRWLPLIVFPCIVAQAFSVSESVPLSAISIFLRWRRKREQKQGRAVTPDRRTDISHAYFILGLFSAGIHTNQGDNTYFWGLCVLLAWALWPLRSRRFGIVAWATTLALVFALGYWGQNGLGRFEQAVEGYNAQWLMRFMRQRTDPAQSMTALGQIGRLKLSGSIVIRLQPKNGEPPPPCLREASYRNYRLQTWYAGSARDEFESISHETNQTTWVLLPGKTNLATVNIACYLNGTAKGSGNPAGLLPLPTGSGRLENLNAYLLQKNNAGAVLAEGPGLVIFDARYGPGDTLDSPAAATNWDLLVPTNERPALDQVISEMKLSGLDEPKTLQAVNGFFQDKFKYSLWQELGRGNSTNETPLSRFLLHSRSGHCEYFATATVLLLRELGIPARYAVGYAVHEPSGKGYVVRERDAHAWCLVWNRQTRTWEDFDTTPASWIEAEGRRVSATQWISDFWSWVRFQIARFRWGQTEWRPYFLWALVPVLALLLYQIIFRRGRKRQRRKPGRERDEAMSWPGLDSEFYQLERRLAERGVPRQPSEPLSDWLARALEGEALKDLRVPLQELLRLHYRHRFDPQGLNAQDRETLKREAKACLDRLTQTHQTGQVGKP
jgi:hypothetical protein